MTTDPLDILIAEADAVLRQYHREYRGLTWRQKILALVRLNQSVRNLGMTANSAAVSIGARDRIRLYLVEHVGQVIAAEEIEVVSGISEYGRRVRELRVEEGFRILTGHSNDPGTGQDLRPNEYLLLDPTPDVTAARRWRLANRIRREYSSSQKRILSFLLANVGQPVTTEELAYVAKAREFGRRTRELRTEAGYAIATKFTGRPDLRMSEYVLESADRIAEPHDRKIPFEVQKQVYDRWRNACALCGWTHEQWSDRDPRILELHHLHPHAEGGRNSPNNLIVACSRCHDDVHAGRRSIPPQIIDAANG